MSCVRFERPDHAHPRRPPAQLRADDSTITVTSLGDRGVEKTFGVIYPPQVALVGWQDHGPTLVENGMLGIRL